MNPQSLLTSHPFLSRLVSIALSLGILPANQSNAERPTVTSPRQTSGDTAIQPAWQNHLTLTVGNHSADLVGSDQRVIQAAIDSLARLGGGTVKIQAGTYHLRNAVHLQSNVHLIGEGPKTLLIKAPSASSPLEFDSDWYDQEITLQDPSLFHLGDGICLRSKDPKTGRETVLKRTLVAQTANRFKLDKPLRENLWQLHAATASTLFPLLSGEFAQDLRVENLVLDGNREHNAELDGNYAGCIFLQDCNRIQIRDVTARNFQGDGISWQISHDVVVENCLVENNKNLALHPGSGSQRPIIRNNTLRGCDIGIFFCWGVKYALAEKNQIEHNRIGVSIGHRDTDNLLSQNSIQNSQLHGLLFRPERGPSFAGHRNRIERNTFLNNGTTDGAIIDIQGGTQDLYITQNTFKETRSGIRALAVKKGPDTKNIAVSGSHIQGAVATDPPAHP